MPGVKQDRTYDCERARTSIDELHQDCDRGDTNNPFSIGESVYARTDGRCDSEWSGPHRISAIRSPVSLELDFDGVTRHISHVKRVPRPFTQDTRLLESVSSSDSDSAESSDDTDRIFVNQTSISTESGSDDEPMMAQQHPGQESSQAVQTTGLRRGQRTRRRPTHLEDYVT